MFELKDENKVIIRQLNGKITSFRCLEPHELTWNRRNEARIFEQGLELGIMPDTLQKLVSDAISELDSEKTTVEIKQNVRNNLQTIQRKTELLLDTVRCKLGMAAVMWVTKGEKLDGLDMGLQYQKIEIMQSNDDALAFFLENVDKKYGTLTNSFANDSLVALLHQMKVLQKSDT